MWLSFLYIRKMSINPLFFNQMFGSLKNNSYLCHQIVTINLILF